MSDTKKLLEKRKAQKKRKPSFERKDSHKKVKLGTKWRKPKGLQNKMRKNLKGHRKNVSSGYRSPKAVRCLHETGLEVVRVMVPYLDNIDTKTQGIEIAATVSMKTRTEIIKEAIKKKIMITNIKDPEALLKKVEEDLKQRKELKKGKEEKKSKTKEELKKKAAEKEKEEKKNEPKSEEERVERKKEKKEEERREAEQIIAQGE